MIQIWDSKEDWHPEPKHDEAKIDAIRAFWGQDHDPDEYQFEKFEDYEIEYIV